MGNLINWIATLEKFESWTWAKCKACVYLVAVLVGLVILFVAVPLIVF